MFKGQFFFVKKQKEKYVIFPKVYRIRQFLFFFCFEMLCQMAACKICKILWNKDSSSSAKSKVFRHRTRQITKILNINYRSRSSKVCHLLANTNRIIKLLMGLIIHQQQWEIQPKEGSIIKNLKTSTSVMVQLTDRWK